MSESRNEELLWQATHVLYTGNRGEQVHLERVGSATAEGSEREVCFPCVSHAHIDSLFRYPCGDITYILDWMVSYRKHRWKNEFVMKFHV